MTCWRAVQTLSYVPVDLGERSLHNRPADLRQPRGDPQDPVRCVGLAGRAARAGEPDPLRAVGVALWQRGIFTVKARSVRLHARVALTKQSARPRKQVIALA